METPQVTYMPDDDFNKLKKDILKAKGRTLSELLGDDEVPTIMWLQGNKVMMRGKDELQIKEMRPFSQIDQPLFQRLQIGRFAQWLEQDKGVPKDVAVDMALQVYNKFTIPMDMPIPEHIKAMIQIETVSPDEH